MPHCQWNNPHTLCRRNFPSNGVDQSDNWCPIEQDFYVDGKAFQATAPRPYRLHLKSGKISRDLGKELNITGVYGREIEGGAGILLDIPLDHSKELKGLTLETLSNDVVIGIMGITLQ